MNRRELIVGSSSIFMGITVPSLWSPCIAVERIEEKMEQLNFVDVDLRAAALEEMKVQFSMGTLDNMALSKLRTETAPPNSNLLPDVPIDWRTTTTETGHEVGLLVLNADPGRTRPGILHMHGGGFVLGTVKGETAYLQAIARTLDCVIVSVDYRLAPETDFRGSTADNYAGLLWMYSNAPSLGLNAKKIAAMGESAGGGHAALLAIRARDKGEVPLAFQALIYPMLDDRTGSTVMPTFPISAVGWNARNSRFGWSSFLGQEPATDSVPVEGVPAHTPSLAGLPPTYICVGGIDLFANETIAFADALNRANAPTEFLLFPGMFHAAERAVPDAAISRRFNAAKIDALSRALQS